jgi:hypothetical protein
LRAAAVFDILGRDNTEELDVRGLQQPSLEMSIRHFVARILGRK